MVRKRTGDDQLELERLSTLRPHLGTWGEHPAGGVERLDGGHRVVWMAAGRPIGPVPGWYRARVGVAPTREHVGQQALPIDGLGQGKPDLAVTEERLARALRIESDEGVGEGPHVLHVHVGAALKREHLLRLEAADEVGRPLQYSPDRHLRVGNGVRAQDQVVEVWLRVGKRVAIQRDGQRVDAGDLEWAGAQRADVAELTRDDLGRRHPIEKMLCGVPHAYSKR